MDIELARFNMIEQQIRPWDVLDPTVLTLLGTVRREDFVPPQHRAMAFVDTQIPLSDAGGPAAPCMLEPRIEARLLQELRVKHHESVLEIGAGSGFMACLLGHQAQQVTSLEIDPALAEMARANLRRAGQGNVKVLTADGARTIDGGPWDIVVLSGSVAEVPKSLLNQLRPGGRLAAIVGEWPVMRARLYTRAGEASWTHVDLFETVAPRLTGFAEASRFHF